MADSDTLRRIETLLRFHAIQNQNLFTAISVLTQVMIPDNEPGRAEFITSQDQRVRGQREFLEQVLHALADSRARSEKSEQVSEDEKREQQELDALLAKTGGYRQ